MKTNAFVRQLASNKRIVRENALKTLKKFLSHPDKANKLNINEFNKLWKGLFYTMWFCDKPRPQQRLANDLSKLFSECIINKQFLIFIESFWIIMNKEWNELDKWRIDKFLMLMRFVIRECFIKLDKENWNKELVKSYLEILKKVILKDDINISRSILFHIVDVWVDELERVLFITKEDSAEEEEEGDNEEKIKERKLILQDKKVPIDLLLEPFKELSGRKHTEALIKRIRIEILEDERLLELGIDTSLPEEGEGEGEEEEEEEWNGFGN